MLWVCCLNYAYENLKCVLVENTYGKKCKAEAKASIYYQDTD